MSPRRIHLSGTEAPAGSVDVGGGSPWANPFKFSEISWAYPSLTEQQVHGMAVNQFRDIIRAGRAITHSVRQFDGSRKTITYTYPDVDLIRSQLAGKDLACSCSPDLPCHADVLLEVANREPIPTPDVLEQIVHQALQNADLKGVHAALTLMAPQDPERAQSLLDTIQLGLNLGRPL